MEQNTVAKLFQNPTQNEQYRQQIQAYTFIGVYIFFAFGALMFIGSLLRLPYVRFNRNHSNGFTYKCAQYTMERKEALTYTHTRTQHHSMHTRVGRIETMLLEFLLYMVFLVLVRGMSQREMLIDLMPTNAQRQKREQVRTNRTLIHIRGPHAHEYAHKHTHRTSRQTEIFR